jgi:hypothetical protein
VVFKNKPPKIPGTELRERLQKVLDIIQMEQRDNLKNFQGDAAPFESCRPNLAACLLMR